MDNTRPFTAIAFLLAMIGPAVAAGPADAPPGASSCSGCHPSGHGVDTNVPRLAGRDPAAMVAVMQAFRSGQAPSTVMDRIAKGLSDDEIKAIAAWYGAQKD
jgi:sulfide dehydrogenase cytochrome subunit